MNDHFLDDPDNDDLLVGNLTRIATLLDRLLMGLGIACGLLFIIAVGVVL